MGGPTPLFGNIYQKCASCDNVNFSSSTIWTQNDTEDFIYENKLMGHHLITDATDMSGIRSDEYDFLLSSNNLEHIANPLKALKEFARVVKVGGILLVLVPMKDRCFDHNREYTVFGHLLDDYENKVQEDDLSHLPEIIEKHDYDMDPACGGKENFIKRAMKNMENRCLHHHVFNGELLSRAFEFAGIKVTCTSVVFNNWLVIGEKS